MSSTSTPISYSMGMPFKNPYMTQSQFAIGRSMFRRTTPETDMSKQFKTQNRNTGTSGRLNALKTKAARTSFTENGVAPIFKSYNPNDVNQSLTSVRNIGYAAPPKASAY